MISIIVPVYNAEAYLSACLDSIMASSYTDFELIIIDDGSTDSSYAICETYQKKDGRIRLLKQQNQGVSAARNTGLAMASGEYVLFVDADDLLLDKACEEISRLQYMRKDILVFGHCMEADVAQMSKQRTDKISIVSLSKESIIESIVYHKKLYNNFVANSPCAKAYRLDFIRAHNLRFPLQLHIGEDAIFNLYACQTAGDIVYCPLPIYAVRINKQSVTRSFRTNLPEMEEEYTDVLCVFAERYLQSKQYDCIKAFSLLYGAANCLTVEIIHDKNKDSWSGKRERILQLAGRDSFVSAYSSHYKLVRGKFSWPKRILIRCLFLRMPLFVYFILRMYNLLLRR